MKLVQGALTVGLIETTVLRRNAPALGEEFQVHDTQQGLTARIRVLRLELEVVPPMVEPRVTVVGELLELQRRGDS